MSIIVTGATGHLGRLSVEALLRRGVPAEDIVATGRNRDRLAELARLGVRTAVADFSDPAGLTAAFQGGDQLLLVSGSEVGGRVAQHSNALTAALEAGIGHVVYTSAPKADTSPLILAPEHKATEELIGRSGIPATILRNGWYSENYLGALQQARETGEIVANVGDGRVASASRIDYAEAAAAVLTDPATAGRIYELSGDYAWNFDELAQTFAELTGRNVVYRRTTPDEHRALLVEAGLDAGTADFVVGLDSNIASGLLAATSGDLRELIGRPTTPLKDGLVAALAE